MTRVLKGGVVVGTYEYDGNGLRVRKIANDVITRFVYNGSQLIAEYEGEQVAPLNSPTKEYYYGPSGLLATIEGDNTLANLHFHTPDHLGSPRVITNSTGKVPSRRDFYPFGQDIEPELAGRAFISGYVSNDNLRQKFTGYERDDESGLDFAQARYFSGVLGRFMQPDEFTGGPVELYYFAEDASDNPTFYADIENPQSLNKYQYCFNNPLRYNDPFGHEGGSAVAEPPKTTQPQNAPRNYPTYRPVSPNPTPSAPSSGGAVAGGGLAAIAAPVAVGLAAGAAVYTYLYADATQTDADARYSIQVTLNQQQIDKNKQAQQQTNQPQAQTPTPEAAEHSKGARKSTKQKHEDANARRSEDRGGEKGDARRRPPRKRHEGHKGPYPFTPVTPGEKDPQTGEPIPYKKNPCTDCRKDYPYIKDK